MKKLSVVFAIALFLFIPLVANADTVGTAYMAISWSDTLPGVPYYVLYYGSISNASFPYSYNGTTVDLFCISSTEASSGKFEFNTISSGTFNPSYYDINGNNVAISSTALSEAAWVADNWKTYGTGSKYDREMAQLAIWKILGIGDYTAGYSEAQQMVTVASSHGDYATSNWYAAFDGQDYLVPKAVPEPGIIILLGIALSAVGLASRHHKS